MKNFPIVMQGLTRFDEKYGATSLALAKEWSKDRLVFYIDHPFTYKDIYSKTFDSEVKFRNASFQNGLRVINPYSELPNFINITPKIVLPINFLPNGKIYELLKKINHKIIKETLFKVLSYYDVNDYYYINSFNPVYYLNLKKKPPLLNIYHCVDLMSGERYIAKHGVKAENDVSKKADRIITTSDQLKLNLMKLNPSTEVVHNGADFSQFQLDHYTVPKEYLKINGKKVVYVGNLGLRINYPLLKKIAQKDRNLQFIFIGPINEREFAGKELREEPNVHFLGPKLATEVPHYLYYADICMIPFVINELTRCIYPLKINEYLSLGKPVLTTNFTDLSTFKGMTISFENEDDFYEGINQCSATEEEIDQRRQFALSNDWTHRAKDFISIIEDDAKNKANDKE
ncbi:glycosyltransferase [Flammeovirga yaeyamensis]|uniref:Glycosyltransferase n=1 Tax=Flammeovirga yaeyamensis TaxID=367791 RepID=A0AAX1N9S9_9BACT|nr:glycosyltransferase [Flammeovirga yaeyamensis]MBB3699252.1 hypothetical protein [Flammeovirga yaeyamensis]NMF35485.1 glycosyltransferase family 1 protein [Flammeovirga yaeyamensis]QWG04344.1 glycosyltransferase [Flammeovirga yaeyamensis]